MDSDDSASSESFYSGSEESERPNRWAGAPSTWHELTAQERGLDASLVELRNRDLSIHLYNSFALKSSARKSSHARGLETGASSSQADRGVDRDDDETKANIDKQGKKQWAPPKVWTAWPLPPEEVPREGERVGPENEDDLFTFKRKYKERPSRGLEDVLVGSALKYAKERWEARETASTDDNLEGESGNEMDIPNDARKVSEQVEGMDLANDDSIVEERHGPTIKASSEPPKENTIFQPILSADDEHSRDLLRPSIRHTLSRLDSALMALHHARQTCRQIGSDSESSTGDEREVPRISRGRSVSKKTPQEDEVLPGGEVTTEESRPANQRIGRPKMFESLTPRSKSAGDSAQETGHTNPPMRTKSKRLGRPLKHYEPLEGEAQDEYLIRVARIQKKPLPKLLSSRPATPEEPEPSIEPEPSRRKRKRGRDTLGTRDWSEVLGSAALVGFPPDVIARTAQRCADLFGEGMIMRELVEDPAGAEDDDFVTTFKPEEIPDLGDELQSSSQSPDEEDAEMNNVVGLKPRTNALAQYNSPCPFESCTRHVQGFDVRSNLKRHLARVHRMTKDEINEILDDSKEMYGGVHVDGFLKPIKMSTGMRGVDKRPRSGSRWSGQHGTDGEESAVEQMEEDDLEISSA